MAFNSLKFALFFFIVVTLYYLPVLRRQQVMVLIAASLAFYVLGVGPITGLLLLSIVVDAIFSYHIRNRRDAGLPVKKLLILALSFDCGILVAFKYGQLLAETTVKFWPAAKHSLFWARNIPLPLGISFYCFEGISLAVDSAKGLFSREKSFKSSCSHVSLFISFFPHLVCGPILRAGNFLPQICIKAFRDVDWYTGLKWLILGYTFKIFVADNIQGATHFIQWPNFSKRDGLTDLVLLCAYSIQIFADSAGYSFIAMGLATLLGYNIPNNFNAPYLSQSLREFWTRWHISLSQWVRDYLFIPLGGSKGSRVRSCFNVFLVMSIGGLWHGASWNFALWGIMHGIGLVVEHGLFPNAGPAKSALGCLLRRTLVFGFVALACILFLNHSLDHAIAFVEHVFRSMNKPGRDMKSILTLSWFILPVFFYHLWYWAVEKGLISKYPVLGSRTVRAFAFACMIFACVLNPGEPEPFIYFQF